MKDKLNVKVQEALQSIEGIDRASAPAFLFTRLEARMQNENIIWNKVSSFFARPAFAIGFIGLIILMNSYFLFTNSIEDASAIPNTELAAMEEYSQVSTNLYEIENYTP